MEMDIGSSPNAHVPLIIELCSFVASEWMTNKSYRPWLLRKLFGDIDYGIKQLAQFQIAVIHRQSNGMKDALAKAGISRSSFFKALW
ncbi:hypothetical protein ERO13_D02G076520v2 [Gossypium hirsutum]|uniref:RNase H type-1 domain-containing protein n=1 Tax=Gossypium raimondii TaxID=29730 RepID=A0A0D2PPX3_GOSRA|nr:hypothetical protein ERO13_D02G076520v2 [Gossypium hirsutum]KJB29123.1 hypothetical protein B456_005G085700 [Gossypium raimondii]